MHVSSPEIGENKQNHTCLKAPVTKWSDVVARAKKNKCTTAWVLDEMNHFFPGMIVKTFGIPQSTMALQSEVLRFNLN